MSDLLEFRDIWVEYGDKIVLERVNLSIAEGSFVAITGPSGAGKSTFLRLALGQESPAKGQVFLDGKVLAPQCDPDRGVVFQRYSVYPHLTVLQNVLLGLEFAKSPVLGRLWGRARRDAVAIATEMLTAVGLQHNLHVYPSALSGGMQQRLAIAQALVKHPRVLLLDEPFGALDPEIRLDMHELILKLWAERRLTILMVTHDLPEAFKLGTRVLRIDKRRRDPQAPHRYGSDIVSDVSPDKAAALPADLATLLLPRPEET
ncbi:ATP-binding cassette domain-containing protein [Asticcacaulis excentricus]|uniref:ABC transporter related protein n=1 Tax=Asticcacaulis excentricus (strain ATCC 15261 / DSM 4724 / KCTC 12464 / NCIMB 9791 / VKM B-1370 / CB 48) TaxID=573065 RepID=E8RVD1_ASTEC|nr:ATP-binding cassette domain-containing protein [Asticcacaulis excentricus]ADU15272.1 ABC transporter related protein [Asticcacaulis excentricus CB 48]